MSYQPIHSCKPVLVFVLTSSSLALVLTITRQGYRLPETFFGNLVGIYRHIIPTRTPQIGYHGITKVTKTADIAERTNNHKSECSSHPIQTPWSQHRKHFFLL